MGVFIGLWGWGFQLDRKQITLSGFGEKTEPFHSYACQVNAGNDRICGHILRVYAGNHECLCTRMHVHMSL